MKSNYYRNFLLVYLLSLFSLNLAFAKDDVVGLSPMEKSWVETHTVKVGVEEWAPFVFSNTGSDIDGIAGDILKKSLNVPA